jgi:competence protein ComEC
LVQQLADLPTLWWGLLLFPLAAVAWRRPVWLVPLAFVAGLVWTGFRAGLILDESLPSALEGKDLIVEGFIADIPQITEFGYRFPFDVVRAAHDVDPVTVPSRVSLSARFGEIEPRAGEGWRLRVRLTRPHGFVNPGGYDYEAHLFRNRLRARGSVRTWLDPLPERPVRYTIDRVREQLGDTIRSALTDHPQGGIVVALANGHARGITPEQWGVLRATGTMHLVAISGLHISLIAGIAFFLFRWLWALPGRTVLWLPAPMAGAIGALVAAAGYAALAGFVIPTQRALIMLIVAMTGVLSRREILPSQLLAAALLAVLAYDPLSVMAPGFWLSFAAVAVILFAMHGAQRSWWRKLGYVQWAIALGLAPLTLWLFQQISLVGPVANMLAVPVFDLLAVPLVLLGIVLTGPFPELAAGLFQAAAWLLEKLWPVLDMLAHLPVTQWWQHQPPAWALLCALVGIAVLLAPRGWPARWVGAFWLLPLFFTQPAAPAAGELWFALLDVGQGLAVVARTEHHALVYDTGPRYSASFDTGESVVVPYLRQAGVRRLDKLVVSHGDNDHAGGMRSVLAAVPVARLESSLPELSTQAVSCVQGEHWEWDGVRFEYLNPPGGVTSRHNNASCVLKITSRHGSVLLPGDIEAKAERRLVAEFGGNLKADVLVAPHHGSKTSSTGEFLEQVRPHHVLFPVGYRNRFHHPHPRVVDRYRALGAESHDSPAAGAIELRLTGGGVAVSHVRERERRYWHAR